MQVGLTTDKWKLTLDDYLLSAQMLLQSMQKYGVSEPVPVDPNGELLDGSHRVACALALGMRFVPVVRMEKYVWAPPWDRDWFVMKKMTRPDMTHLMSDWEKMHA